MSLSSNKHRKTASRGRTKSEKPVQIQRIHTLLGMQGPKLNRKLLDQWEKNRCRSHHVKCVVVGDSTVGKTSLVFRYSRDQFPTEYAPTVCDNFGVKLVRGEASIDMDLWDTAGQEEYDRLRILSYPNTDVFVMCFSISERDSFEKIESRWLPELKHHAPFVPRILVGNKLDVRELGTDRVRINCESDEDELIDSYENYFVSYNEGSEFADKAGLPYFECSALTNDRVDEVFIAAVESALSITTKKKAKRCVVL